MKVTVSVGNSIYKVAFQTIAFAIKFFPLTMKKSIKEVAQINKCMFISFIILVKVYEFSIAIWNFHDGGSLIMAFNFIYSIHELRARMFNDSMSYDWILT